MGFIVLPYSSRALAMDWLCDHVDLGTTLGLCWFHRLRNVVSSNKGIFLIDDDQEAGIASKTDGG